MVVVVVGVVITDVTFPHKIVTSDKTIVLADVVVVVVTDSIVLVVIVVFVFVYFRRVAITRNCPRSTLVAALFLLMMVSHCFSLGGEEIVGGGR